MRMFPLLLLLLVVFAVNQLNNYGKLKHGKWDDGSYSERTRWRMLSGDDHDDLLPSCDSPGGRNDEHQVNKEVSRTAPSEKVKVVDKETGESMLVDVGESGGKSSPGVAEESGPSLRGRDVRDVRVDQETRETLQGGATNRRDLTQHGEEETGDDSKRAKQDDEAGVRSMLNDTVTAIKDNGSNLLRSVIGQINFVQGSAELLKVANEEERQPSGGSVLSKEGEEATPGDFLGGNNPNGGEKGELPNGTKNDVMIKGYANVLLNEGKHVLVGNVRNFLSRVFNLIVREKIMTRMCHRGGEASIERSGEPVGERSGEPTGERSGDPTGERSGDPTGERSGEPTGERSGEPTGERSGEPTAERSGEPTAERSDEPTAERSDEPTADPKGDPTNCRLPKRSATKFYQSEDLYNYYSSLEEMLKGRGIRWKTDRVSRYFTFSPSKKIKDNFEEVMNNKVFIESVRSILFDSHKKNKKAVFSSFAVVVETLFSLIKEEKVIADMYSYVKLFFQDLDILNLKVLHFLSSSSTENTQFVGPPDLSLTNFEYILAKIYSRSVLANILSPKMNHSDSKKLSKLLTRRENNLKFSFLEGVKMVHSAIPSEGVSAVVLGNAGGQVNVPIPGADDTLCKFIPIRKKLLYERLSVTRKVAEEVILDYLFRLLLRKVHEYVLE
ncbi:hypothetical protein, conserved [Plasmodium vivax]|uniref:Sporozoite-specific protein S10 n=1 Tax=Plasmodium vivax (strain Salvador I) TaxID=126793 RepID=A5KAP7_PLAVS|nr:hypothetical protein, conserved [Plasmodium vivax]EDL43646.1 hypothetical protein, conserved [Plasmodium vivax]|eukprot:XP_001613373.1 hypothetical protein [Plasmodium vivax Sal-1]